MTFEEIDQKLPNGFHDGKIRSIRMDFVGISCAIEMELHAGEQNDPERYRPGMLRVTAPCLFFIEPPDPRYPFIPDGSPLKIDGDSVRVGQSAEVDRLMPALPQNSILYRFFLEEWNSFLYLGGSSVELSWDDGGVLG